LIELGVDKGAVDVGKHPYHPVPVPKTRKAIHNIVYSVYAVLEYALCAEFTLAGLGYRHGCLCLKLWFMD
jgi:hypothetical protein